MRELSVVEQRYRAVMEVLAGASVVEVAERYGVSRQSVHTWLRRYAAEGLDGLADRSHRSHGQPAALAGELEALICELRREHRRWGPRRLEFELARRGYGVARSTVYRVLVRNHLVEPRARRRKREDYIRWERPEAMQLWQLDVTASLFLADGSESKIVTGIDDHSRFCVMAKVVRRATARAVCLAFIEALRVYGVPEEVLSDNGKVFTGRFTRPTASEVLFERIGRENGITTRLTKPASPTTTGKIERLHQSLQIELLDDHGPFESISDAQVAVDGWREGYNTDRPHQSLGMSAPADRFRANPADGLELVVPEQLSKPASRALDDEEAVSTWNSGLQRVWQPPEAVELKREVPPSGKRLTVSPTASTTPANSLPRMVRFGLVTPENPRRNHGWQARKPQSVRLTVVAWTRTSISSASGAGRGTSMMCTTSGGPLRVVTAAFIAVRVPDARAPRQR
jgi:transposase InsO family protein